MKSRNRLLVGFVKNKTLDAAWMGLTVKKHALRGTFIEFLLVGLLFFILTFFYTNGTLLHPASSLFVNSPGDGTAGITWMLSVDKGFNPVPPHTDMVNYPDGVDLASPLLVTSPLIELPAWVLSRFMPALAAINVMMYVAFIGIGLLGYWLLKRLTGRWYIALFAAYTLAFMPYHIFKSVAHIANIFSWMFVALIAASIYIWQKPSWKSSLAVALSVAAGFYTDGYYLLLSSVMVLTLSAGGLIAKTILDRGDIARYLRALFMAAGMTVLLSIPILAVQITSGQKAASELANARSDIKTEAWYYSAWTLDFITPPAESPFFKGIPIYDEAHVRKEARSNRAESALFIGYTVVFLTAGGLGLTLFLFLDRHKRHKWQSRVSEADRTLLILLSAFVVVTVPIMWSLMGPLERTVFGIRLPMLSGILTDYVALWRVLTRLILPLHALLAVFAAYSLYIFLKLLLERTDKKLLSPIVTLLLLSVVAVEYATAINRPSFSFARMPDIYREVKERNDVKVIAELPMTDKPVEVNGFYATGQLIHGKKLINSHVSSYNNGAMSALGDEENPETIDYIRARGADHVITHSNACEPQVWGVLEYTEVLEASNYGLPEFRGKAFDHVCLYKLKPATPKDELFVAIDLNDYMNGAGQEKGVYETYAKFSSVTLRLVDKDGRLRPSGESALVHVDAHSETDTNYSWTFSQNGTAIASGTVDQTREANISGAVVTGEPIELSFTRNDGQGYPAGDIALRNYEAIER